MIKWFKKLQRIIKCYDRDIAEAKRTAINAQSRADVAESFIRERTDVSAELGVRSPSTIILTGVYKGREYVEIFDMGCEDFHHFAEQLKEMKRHHRVKSIDTPYGFKATIDSSMLY